MKPIVLDVLYETYCIRRILLDVLLY